MYRELTVKEAPKVGIAPSKFRDMELGYHNFTLGGLAPKPHKKQQERAEKKPLRR